MTGTVVKFIKTKGRMVVTRGWGTENGELLFRACSFSYAG